MFTVSSLSPHEVFENFIDTHYSYEYGFIRAVMDANIWASKLFHTFSNMIPQMKH